MIYYYALIFFLFLCDRLIKTNKNIGVDQGRVLFAVLSGIALWIIIGFRDFTVGRDTSNYLDNLYFYSPTFLNVNFQWYLGYLESSEPNLPWLMFFFKNLGCSPFVFNLVISAFFAYTFVWFFYKYSENIFLSCYLYITYGLFGMTLSGMRNILAICFSLYAFHFMMKRQIIPYFLFIFLAYKTHNSAICFLPLYIFNYFNKINRKTIVFFILIIGLMLISYQQMGQILQHVSSFAPERYQSERYQNVIAYEEVYKINPLLGIVATVILVTSILFWRYVPEAHKRKNTLLLICVFFFTFWTIASLGVNQICRLSMYFSTMTVTLIPNLIAYHPDLQTRRFGIIGICFLLLIMFTKVMTNDFTEFDVYGFYGDPANAY